MTHPNTTHSAGAGAPGSGHLHAHSHEVAVTIDGRRQEIAAGSYRVSTLKARLGVPPDYELDEVVHGEFRALEDTAHIEIKGGEHFISHVRRGGSS